MPYVCYPKHGVSDEQRSPSVLTSIGDLGSYPLYHDASVFVSASNHHEQGHAQSLEFLAATQERGDPIIVPTLLAAEIASAVARTINDAVSATNYASVILALPHLTLVSLTPATARRAAELAATHRLRGADSLYLDVARRYATTLVSRDNEQLTRGAAIAVCQTPEAALS